MSAPQPSQGIFRDLSRQLFGAPRLANRVIRALRDAVTAIALLCAGVLIVMVTFVAIALLAAVAA